MSMRPSSAVSRSRPGSAVGGRRLPGSSRPSSAVGQRRDATATAAGAPETGRATPVPGGAAYDSDTRVQVVVRVRPHLPRCDGADPTLSALPSSPTVVVVRGPEREKAFEFDHVLDGDQQQLFQAVGKPMLAEALRGFNVCLFAYGATSSGKTHSVQGEMDSNNNTSASAPVLTSRPEGAGLMPRLVDSLFDELQQRIDEDPNLSVKVTLSAIEVYMEKVRDLLAPRPSPSTAGGKAFEPESLELQDDGARRVRVKGLSTHNVLNAERVKELMQVALANRQVAETKVNEVSSRSHCLVQLTVTQFSESADSGRDIESIITLVDLAGSERQTKSGTSNSEQLLEEGKKINLSLLTLGRALHALGDGRGEVVSLRDSKLTRLLGESLGGNSKTWMLANVAASSCHVQETLSTLEYATYARCIANTGVHINQFQVSLVEATRQKLLETIRLRNQQYAVEHRSVAVESVEMLQRVKLATLAMHEKLAVVEHFLASRAFVVETDKGTKSADNNKENQQQSSGDKNKRQQQQKQQQQQELDFILDAEILKAPHRAHAVKATAAAAAAASAECGRRRCTGCGSQPTLFCSVVVESDHHHHRGGANADDTSRSSSSADSSVSYDADGEQQTSCSGGPHRVDLRLFSLENLATSSLSSSSIISVFVGPALVAATDVKLEPLPPVSSSGTTESCEACSGAAMINFHKSVYCLRGMPAKIVVRMKV